MSTRSKDGKKDLTSTYELGTQKFADLGGGLPLFTQLSSRGLLGNLPLSATLRPMAYSSYTFCFIGARDIVEV
jgi:hypothetical protein